MIFCCHVPSFRKSGTQDDWIFNKYNERNQARKPNTVRGAGKGSEEKDLVLFF